MKRMRMSAHFDHIRGEAAKRESSDSLRSKRRWKKRRENGLEWSKTTSSHTACAQGAAMPYGTPFLPPAGGANRGAKNKRKRNALCGCAPIGSPCWARTSDNLINSQVLCQLS